MVYKILSFVKRLKLFSFHFSNKDHAVKYTERKYLFEI